MIYGAHLKRGDTWLNKEAEVVSENHSEVLLKTTETTPEVIPLARDRSSASDTECESEDGNEGQFVWCPTPQQRENNELAREDVSRDSSSLAEGPALTPGELPRLEEEDVPPADVQPVEDGETAAAGGQLSDDAVGDQGGVGGRTTGGPNDTNRETRDGESGADIGARRRDDLSVAGRRGPVRTDCAVSAAAVPVDSATRGQIEPIRDIVTTRSGRNVKRPGWLRDYE